MKQKNGHFFCFQCAPLIIRFPTTHTQPTHTTRTQHRWITRFKSGSLGVGEYSYFPNHPTSIYGSTDMLMTLHIVGQVNLTDSEKDKWANVINSFQVLRPLKCTACISLCCARDVT